MFCVREVECDKIWQKRERTVKDALTFMCLRDLTFKIDSLSLSCDLKTRSFELSSPAQNSTAKPAVTGCDNKKNKLGLRQEPCEFVMSLFVPTAFLMVWALFCLVFIRDSSYVHFSLVQPLFERPHLICKCVFRCLITSFAPWIHLTSIACTIKCFHLTPCLVFIPIGLRTK